MTGLGIIASYSARFWTLVIGLGVISGLAAAALVGLLRLVERLSYGVHGRRCSRLSMRPPSWRRIVALLLAAVIVIVGLRVLGRASTGGTEVTEAIWLRSGKLDFVHSLARGVLSIVTVGMGVSLGREAGAAARRALRSPAAPSEWAKLPVWQRRLLVASGAGAGFAAVYNVPLGGTLLALEVMLGTLALPLVLPALLMSRDRDRGRLDLPRRPPDLSRRRRQLPSLAARVRDPDGPDHRPGRDRLDAADRRRQPRPPASAPAAGSRRPRRSARSGCCRCSIRSCSATAAGSCSSGSPATSVWGCW